MLIAKIFTCLAAFMHMAFFLVESFFWKHPAVIKTFGSSQSEAQITSLLAFNQGFYNLFLALGSIAGIILLQKGQNTIGLTLIIFTLLCMVGAAVVLAISSPKMLRGVIMQGLPPLIALLAVYFSVGKAS